MPFICIKVNLVKIGTTILCMFLSLLHWTVQGQVTVTATAGLSSATYHHLSESFAAINNGIHKGNIEILITANLAEPDTPTHLIRDSSGAARYDRIHIQPVGNRSVTSYGSAAVPYSQENAEIGLLSVKNVCIDGDDPNTPGPRNLVFLDSNKTNIPCAMLLLYSNDTFSNTPFISHDTIRNCVFIGRYDSIAQHTANGGIVIGSTGYYRSDLIENNIITKCYTAIGVSQKMQAYSPAISPPALSISIKDNILGDDDPLLANQVGITAYYSSVDTLRPTHNMLYISGNEIKGSHHDADVCGIYLQGYIAGAVDHNNIHHLTGYLNGDPYGIKTLTKPVSYNDLSIHDNHIHHLASSGRVVTGIYATQTNQGDTQKIYHNLIDSFYTEPFGAIGISATYADVGGNTVQLFNNLNSIVGIYTSSSDVHDNIVRNLMCEGSQITGIETRGPGAVYNNKIFDLRCAGGIWGCSFASTLFYNNMISGLSIDHSSYLVGVQIFGPGSSFDNNTIVMDTNARASLSACVSTYANSFYSFRNNILVNRGQYPACGISSIIPAATFATLESNNLYYTPHGRVAMVGNPAVPHDLRRWQTATGKESQSDSVFIPFISLDDPHIDTTNPLAAPTLHSGTPVTGHATTDIDFQLRQNPPCIGADEFYNAVSAIADPVWPGDADNNGIVDLTDIFPVGLSYDSSGPLRTARNIVWTGDSALNWGQTFAGYTAHVDFKHADCNGDGHINASDTDAIVTNYSLVHAKTNGQIESRAGAPSLFLHFSRDSVTSWDTFHVDVILADSLLPVSDIYGLKFKVSYNMALMDTTVVKLSYLTSWFADSTHTLTLDRQSKDLGELTTAICGLDHMARTGHGQIASLSFKVNPISIFNPQYQFNKVSISEIVAVDHAGQSIIINGATDSNVVYRQTAYSGVPETDPWYIHLYPNPAQRSLTVESDFFPAHMALSEIYDATGRLVQIRSIATTQATYDLSDMTPGVYCIKFCIDGHTVIKRFVKLG